MTVVLTREILALPSDVARAEWLVQCPDWDFIGWIGSIRRALELAGFPEAVTYLERRLASLQARRSAAGELPNTFLMGVHFSRAEMLAAARTRDGAKNG